MLDTFRGIGGNVVQVALRALQKFRDASVVTHRVMVEKNEMFDTRV